MAVNDVKELVTKNDVFREVIDEIIRIHEKSPEVTNNNELSTRRFRFRYLRQDRPHTRYTTVVIHQILEPHRSLRSWFKKVPTFRYFFRVDQTIMKKDDYDTELEYNGMPPTIEIERFDLNDTVTLVQALVELSVWCRERESLTKDAEGQLERDEELRIRDVRNYASIVKQELGKLCHNKRVDGQEWEFLSRKR